MSDTKQDALATKHKILVVLGAREMKLQKLPILVGLWLLVATTNIRADDLATASFKNPDDKMNLFTSKAGRFEVRLPGETEPWNTSFQTKQFGKMKVFHVSSQDEPNKTMYGVAYHDYPRKLTEQEVKRELEHAKTLPDVNAKILKVKELKIQGYPAYEVTTKIGPIHMISRYCIVDKRRLYSLQVGSPNDLKKQSDQVGLFFQSFKLKKE